LAAYELVDLQVLAHLPESVNKLNYNYNIIVYFTKNSIGSKEKSKITEINK